jgi:hypothetical protein
MVSSDNVVALFSFLKELNFTSIVKAQVVARRQCDVTADGWPPHLLTLANKPGRGEGYQVSVRTLSAKTKFSR